MDSEEFGKAEKALREIGILFTYNSESSKYEFMTPSKGQLSFERLEEISQKLRRLQEAEHSPHFDLPKIDYNII